MNPNMLSKNYWLKFNPLRFKRFFLYEFLVILSS